MALQSTDLQEPETAADRGPPPATSRAMGSALFRQEVLQRRSNHGLGKPTLAVPVSFKVYSAAAMGLILLIGALLFFCSYAPTETVNAVIVPASGIAKVFGTASGTVVTRYVREGQPVSAGTPVIAVRAQQAAEGQNDMDYESRRTGQPDVSTPARRQPSEAPARVRTGIGDRRSEPANGATSIVDIKAPVDGTVYQLNKDVGEIFYDFEPLASIATDGDLVASAQVSPAVHARLAIGMPVRMELKAFKGRTIGKLGGQIIAIATGPTESGNLSMREQGPTYKVVIRIDQAASALPRKKLLGKVVSISLSQEKRKLYQWLLDPLKALFSS